ncbi:hypothetical protein D8Z77_11340 [Brevibacillus laterosporus]|nr:hypothetical protein D8Z77_11340 [Brevibacillus laterosporus]
MTTSVRYMPLMFSLINSS